MDVPLAAITDNSLVVVPSLVSLDIDTERAVDFQSQSREKSAKCLND